jgi:hypothetical protein
MNNEDTPIGYGLIFIATDWQPTIPADCPTPEEIAEHCEKIQKTWSREEEKVRRGIVSANAEENRRKRREEIIPEKIRKRA